MELTDIRREIDTIDDELARLFVRRMEAASAVAAAKRATGKAVCDPAREREVLARAEAKVGPGFAGEARTLFSTLMAVSRAHQHRLLASASGGCRDTRSAAERVKEFLAGQPRVRTLAVVTDSNVDRLHGDAFVRSLESTGLRIERVLVAAGERSKTLDTYVELVRAFAAFRMTRDDLVLALGGGVTGDLAGFAAATYMRGVDFIQVPTSLLAMVDSSIGGKTGVDIPEGKNLVGAFHLPKLVVRDPAFLDTLPECELLNGFAEMIKTAILFDPALFGRLRAFGGVAAAREKARRGELAEMIEGCAAWKERIVAEDFREGGKRKLLNLGHTFGHAIEKTSDFTVPHGVAVAMGMRLVGGAVPEIAAILDEWGYPKYDAKDSGRVLAAIASDKKVAGDSVDLIVPRAIGRCEIVPTPLSELGRFMV